jgi:hypothetical protein
MRAATAVNADTLIQRAIVLWPEDVYYRLKEYQTFLGEKPGIYSHDIMVLVNEPAAECFALGGVMQCTLTPTPEEDEDL